MPKLPRVTAKIFASNAAQEDIGQYGSALTGTKITTGDIAVIQALPAYETGWRGAVISDRNYPTLQEMNGLQKTFSQQIAYILQNGMPEWNSETEYFINQFCRVDNILYSSLTDNNIANNPVNNTTNWKSWDFNTKADINLSNTTKTANTKIAHCAMPSKTKVANIFGSSLTTAYKSYTAPADGEIDIVASSDEYNALNIMINDVTVCWQGTSAVGKVRATFNRVVSKGDVIKARMDTRATTTLISYFNYANGTV